MRTFADLKYRECLLEVLSGEQIETRNAKTFSNIAVSPVVFTSTPLVTFRKTAWKKALREMEWFFSGQAKCPEELLDWWSGQLDEGGYLFGGYSIQFRRSRMYFGEFDQVAFIRKELKTHPNSRRLVMTTWHPEEMAKITKLNNNLNTPTCCHGIVIQFFVRGGKLHMTHYQRSADMLLGVPHNWIQYWAMLLYFAHHAGLEAGSLRWFFGDAHIYMDDSHLQVVDSILSASEGISYGSFGEVELVYSPSSEEFLAKDFSLVGEVDGPITKIRPKLL